MPIIYRRVLDGRGISYQVTNPRAVACTVAYACGHKAKLELDSILHCLDQQKAAASMNCPECSTADVDPLPEDQAESAS